MINAPAWFLLLDRAGWLQGELDSADEQRVAHAVNYLDWHVRDVPERIAEVILPWVDKPNPWPAYAANILAAADAERSHHFVDLYTSLVAKGHVSLEQPPFAASGGLTLFYDLPEKKAGWAVEVFAEWLIAFVNKRHNEGQKNPFRDTQNPYSHRVSGIDDRLDIMTKNAPAEFVKRVLPITLELIRRNAVRHGPKPWPDTVWPYYMKSDHYNLDGF